MLYLKLGISQKGKQNARTEQNFVKKLDINKNKWKTNKFSQNYQLYMYLSPF